MPFKIIEGDILILQISRARLKSAARNFDSFVFLLWVLDFYRYFYYTIYKKHFKYAEASYIVKKLAVRRMYMKQMMSCDEFFAQKPKE